jgi:hypothetical protein
MVIALLAALTTLVRNSLADLARALITSVWHVYRNPAIQGAAFLGLNGSGLGMILGSRAVTGWWQAALLGFGTGLVLAGTVELGILGVIGRITGQNGQQRELGLVVQIDGEMQAVVQPVSPDTAANPREVAAILRELASSLERGTAEG